MNDDVKHIEPHWDRNFLVVHLDEVRAALDRLPPDVEMRVRNIISNAHHVRRPGFMLAFTIGTDPYDLTDRDLKHLLEAIQGLGYDPGPTPEGLPPSPEPESEVTYTRAEVEELAQLMYQAGQGGRDGDAVCDRFLANHGQRR